MSQDHSPPKWADKFLAWYCNPRLLEQIQGDVHELYYWRLEEKGHRKAQRSFVWDVIRLFKWANIKRTKGKTQKLNNIAMIKNYFKVGIRNLWKQRMPSTINIIGLSLAIGCCLVSFKWIEQIMVRDGFHEKANDIFLITPAKINEGDIERLGYLPSDLAATVQEEMVGVIDYTRLSFGASEIKVDKREFQDRVMYVDAGYFDMFSFDMLYGTGESIKDLGSVILSKAMAERYFPEEFALGKKIDIDGKEYVVNGIIDDAPSNTSLRHRIMLNFDILDQNNPEVFRTNVLVELDDVSAETIDQGLARLKSLYNAEHEESPYETITLESLKTMAHNSREISSGLGSGMPMGPVILLLCIGGFLLILATFNYINIATSMAMKRVKEIGVRKVIGGKRNQLIYQFLVENLVLVTIAMVIGILLASAYFLPGFNSISGSDLKMDILEHKNLWIFLSIMLVFITLASGAYPAFYISSFKPVAIFRGNSHGSKKRRLTAVLLTFQMSLAVVTIMAAVMFVYSNQVNLERSWGYKSQGKWVIEYPENVPKSALNEALVALPEVNNLSGSRGAIGRVFQDQDVYLKDGRQFEAAYFEVDDNYLQLLEVPLWQGTFFKEEVGSEDGKTAIVNEEFIRAYGQAFEPNMTVNFHHKEYQVVGVVKDFHFRAFDSAILPAIFIRVADSLHTSVTVDVTMTDESETREMFKEVMDELAPDEDHGIFAQSSVFDSFFEESRGMQNIMTFVAVLAVLLSGMGLYGLVSVSISSKIKDFSIKKTLGASAYQLGKDVYKRFSAIIAFALVIGGAGSFFLVGLLLRVYYGGNEQPMGVFPLSIGALLLITVAFLTIYSKVHQVRQMNPAESLRVE